MGYIWMGIQKIDYKQALKRYHNELEVYLLHDDGSESLVQDSELSDNEELERMRFHSSQGGEFGFEKQWQIKVSDVY